MQRMDAVLEFHPGRNALTRINFKPLTQVRTQHANSAVTRTGVDATFSPAFGKNNRHCGTANHFAKVCMERGQDTRQLHAVDTEVPEGMGRPDTEAHI